MQQLPAEENGMGTDEFLPQFQAAEAAETSQIILNHLKTSQIILNHLKANIQIDGKLTI